MNRVIFGTIVLFLLSLTASAQEPAEPSGASPMDWGIEYQRGAVKVGVWSAAFTGDIKFVKEVAGERIGENLDLVDDLDLENPAGAINLDVEVKASRRNRFSFSFFGTEYTGNVTEVEGIDVFEFEGDIFDMDIDTAVSMMRIYAGYEFMPLVTPRGDLGLSLGIDYYTLGIGLKSELPDVREDVYLPMLLPAAGVRGQYTFGYGLGVYGGIRGMGVAIEDGEVSFSEVELGLSFKYKRLYSSIGLRSVRRYIEVGDDVEDEDYGRVDLMQDGGLIKIGLNF